MPIFYFVIVNYWCGESIAHLLRSLAQDSPDQNCQILIVNNSPEDRSLDAFSTEFAHCTILETGENLGFGRACNRAIAWVADRDPGAIVWLINPDAWLPAGTIAAARSLLSQADWAILGTAIDQPDGRPEFRGGRFDRRSGLIEPMTQEAPTDPKIQPTDWVSGCSLLINLAAFRVLPQFDRRFFLYYEDFEFCRRYARQGYSVAIAPSLRVIHATSTVTGRQPERKLRWSIGGYLLALAIHGSRWALVYRLARILISAIAQWPQHPARSRAKLQGLADAWQSWRSTRNGSPRR